MSRAPGPGERNLGDGLRVRPAGTDLSNRVSKDLKRRGFTFVGTTKLSGVVEVAGPAVGWARAGRWASRRGGSAVPLWRG
ncbi:DNA-3-methyladenine glycosylase I [Streptomyces sp. NPDC000851]